MFYGINLSEGNFTRSAQDINHQNELKNYTQFRLQTYLLRGQWVKETRWKSSCKVDPNFLPFLDNMTRANQNASYNPPIRPFTLSVSSVPHISSANQNTPNNQPIRPLYLCPVFLTYQFSVCRRWVTVVMVIQWNLVITLSDKTGYCMCTTRCFKMLAYWGWDKMAAICQTTFSNSFSWMKMV